MPTSYTNLLGLALPVTGELSGTWGDTVNDYITQYLDASVAGTQTISGSQTAVTLSKTTNASLSQAGSGATGSSQYLIINCTGNPAGLLTITAPAASKPYIVINGTSTSQQVKLVGAGPTTGVTLDAGEKAVVAWNGSDFVKVASSAADGVASISFGTTGLTPSTATTGAVTVAGTLAATNGGTGQSTYAVGDLLYASTTTALSKLADVATGNALISGGVGVAPSYGKIGLTTHVSGTLPVANGGTGLTSGTSGGVLYYSASGTLASSAALASNALVVGGGAGVAPSTITTGTGVVTALGVNTGTAGAFVVNGGALGTPSSGTVTNLTGTASININGTVGATTPNTGAFTSVTSTSASGILTRAAATQDGVELIGRAGGTTSLKVTLTPTTLTASRTVTLPNADINFTTGLGVAQGGTGTTSLTANNVILGNGTSAVQFVAPGTNGNVLTSNGTTWVSQAAGASLSGQTDSASPFETSLGYQAGNVNTALYNTFIGYQAGLVNSTGDSNTAVGYFALTANTTGGSNVAVGRQTLRANTTGSLNTALGSQALFTSTTASNNTAIGYQSLNATTTGSDNTALGTYTLTLNTTGANNTAVGSSALYANTTGTDNTAVGYAALDANTTGGGNTAFGTNALGANTTAFYNTAIGFQSLDANTTGTYNTALGYDSLTRNTTGTTNVAVGYNAAAFVTTGSNNTAVGAQSLQNLTTGSYNVAVGDSALIGSGGGQFTGGYNIGIGYYAVGLITTGTNNIGIGAETLRGISTGTNNVAIGHQAIYSITTGANNTAVGYQAGYSLTTGSNNIVIGNGAAASSATVSNEVTIGNTSITSTRLRGMVELNAAMFEAATVSATAATGTINFDARSQSVLYYTTNASGNWTLNIRAASGVSLDSVMSTGESMTVAFLVTNGATAYYQTALQVDGSAVTPKWQGGTPPAAGNPSSIDVYVITIIKTGAATFTALESQTQFA